MSLINTPKFCEACGTELILRNRTFAFDRWTGLPVQEEILECKAGYLTQVSMVKPRHDRYHKVSHRGLYAEDHKDWTSWELERLPLTEGDIPFVVR